MTRMAAVLMGALVLAACGGTPDEVAPGDTGEVIDMAKAGTPTGKGVGTLAVGPSRLNSRNKLTYHNGPVMTGTSNVYLIWYGNWTGNSAEQILTEMVATLGGSAYFRINSRYPEASGAAPTGGLVYSGSAYDTTYSHGAALSDADLADVVSQSVLNGALPLDQRGVYVVLASADVTATSGFCSSYCGQHNVTTVVGSQVRWIFVGNADRCPSACAAQTGVSPNGNPGADAMANVLANELSTTITDPSFASWYDRDGLENADKCAWNFGTTYTTANGARANINVGGRDFLLQRNWVPTARGGVCASDLAAAAVAIAAGEDIL